MVNKFKQIDYTAVSHKVHMEASGNVVNASPEGLGDSKELLLKSIWTVYVHRDQAKGDTNQKWCAKVCI